MKKLIERLLIFILGIPAIVALVLFADFYNNLALNLIIVLLSGIGAVEFSSMLEKKQIKISKVKSFFLGAVAPLSITLHISFNLPLWIVPVLIMAGIGWVLITVIFTRLSDIESVIFNVIGNFSLIIYPGSFMYWLIKMKTWENNYAILLFLFIIFASDSMAWLFGTLFGANNRGIVPVSPNKSIAGFIGGFLGPLIIAFLAVFIIFPDNIKFFPVSFSFYDTPVSAMFFAAFFLGFFPGLAAMLGDLAESAIKRSCDFKDSGNLMLGRGGILDSLDSIAVAAPVFYLIYHYLFIL